MGGEVSKEATTLEKLQEMCKAGGLGEPGWVMHKRYKEMEELVEANRVEYLRCGGVAATIALMLSMPGDEKLQEFCVKIVAKAKPELHQVAVGWRPLISAVKNFPANDSIQELGTFLLLRATLTPEMEDETVEESLLLKTSADTLLETAGESMLTVDIMTPEGSSLCGEVLKALNEYASTRESITELRFKTLALTSHFVAPQEVGLILTTLRKTLKDQNTPRSILLSSLFTMQRMYQASQLHVYPEDIQILLEVRHDHASDLETTLRVIKVMESFAYTPSAPCSISSILQSCEASMTCGDTHEAVLTLLHTYLTHCSTLLLSDCAIFAKILTGGMRSDDVGAVEKSAEVLHLVLDSDDMVQLLSKGGAGEVAAALLEVKMMFFECFLKGMRGWGGVGCFTEDDLGVIVNSVCRFVSDALQSKVFNPPTMFSSRPVSPTIIQALEVLTEWANGSFIPSSHHPPLLSLVEQLVLTHPGLYDRPAVLLLTTLPLPSSTPRVHTLLGVVYLREKQYWFPSRAVLQKIKDRALEVPIDKAMTWSPPREFVDSVYGKQR